MTESYNADKQAFIQKYAKHFNNKHVREIVRRVYSDPLMDVNYEGEVPPLDLIKDFKSEIQDAVAVFKKEHKPVSHEVVRHLHIEKGTGRIRFVKEDEDGNP